MGTQRRAGSAAIAAALIGVGLALYRPRLVPELRAGSRAAPPPAAATFAAAIAWPPAPRLASATAGSAGGAAHMEEEEEYDALRDAPSDRGPANGGPFPSASGAPAAGGSRADRALRDAPSSAETDGARPSGSSELAASGPRKNATRSALGKEDGGAPAKNGNRRALLASGAAGPDAGASARMDERPAVDARRGAPSSAAAWFRRPYGSFPLFRPPLRAFAHGARAKAAAHRKIRPLLLSKLLGRGALRPPPAALVPPDFTRLNGRRPLLLPNGAATPTRPYELDRIEAQDPRRAAACRRRAPHWDAGPIWHDGSAHGLVSDARWLWLWKEDARVWAVPEPDAAPLLRHQGLWWSKQRGVWFALHDGELWSWRRFSDWDAEGLIRLADGVELVYSADFTKVAAITPGAGAVLYDAATGAELGEWLEDELPRRRPRAPAGLRLPRGI